MASDPPRDRAETAFRDFRITGDPEALAEVFDAVASSMLLLAAHFTRDPGVAEDCVQTAFLQLIQDSATYDQTQPLLPWLLTVVANRARDHLRAERRRPAGELRSEPLGIGADPSLVAQEREAQQQVVAAIAALESRYRDLLVLHLLHGLEPIEIAHSLGRPPATVRTQLRRGLERLRQALPASIAVPSAVFLVGGEGFAAMRDQVLSAVPRTWRTVITTSLGSVAMKKSLLAAVVLLVTVGLAMVWQASTPVTPTVDPVATGELAAGVRTPSAATARPGEESRRGTAPSARPVTVRGRCLTEESELPLADCRVVVGGRLGTPTQADGRRWLEWTDPPEFVTDARGHFEVTLQQPQLIACWLEFRARGRVHRVIHLDQLEDVAELGTVYLALGAELCGRFVDQQRRPVAEVIYSIQALTDNPARRRGTGREPIAYRQHSRRRASATGEFTSPGPLRPGFYQVEVHGMAMVTSSVVEVPPGVETVEKTFVIGAMDQAMVVAGTVRDIDGRPLRDLVLYLRQAGGRGRREATILADGGFVVSKIGRPFGLSLENVDPAPGKPFYELVGEYSDCRPGTLDLQVLVRRVERGALELHVGDALSGRNIERFGYWVFTRDRRCILTGYVPATIHPGGVVRLAGLLPGPYFVSVYPESHPAGRRAAAIKLPVDVLPGGAATRCEVALHQPVDLTVAVTGSGPIADARVELVQAYSGTPSSMRMSVFDLSSRTDGCADTQCFVRVANRQTDRRGAARFAVAPGQGDLFLAVSHPRHQRTFVPVPAIAPTGARVSVRIDAAFELRGRVTPDDVLRQHLPPGATRAGANLDEDEFPEILLVPAAGGGRPVGRGHVGVDGLVCISQLPPGEWQVMIQTRLVPAVPIGRVRGAAGATVQQEFGISKLRASSLLGRVVFDGITPKLAKLQLLGPLGSFDSVVGADGSIRFAAIPSGRYQVILRWFDSVAVTETSITAATPCVVGTGDRLAVVISLAIRRYALRLLDADGKPTAAWLRISSLDATGAATTRSYQKLGPDGRFVVPAVPGTRLAFDRADSKAARWLRIGTRELPQRGGTTEILDVRLSAPISGKR